MLEIGAAFLLFWLLAQVFALEIVTAALVVAIIAILAGILVTRPFIARR
jgi:hypothetical protein